VGRLCGEFQKTREEKVLKSGAECYEGYYFKRIAKMGQVTIKFKLGGEAGTSCLRRPLKRKRVREGEKNTGIDSR